MTIQEKLDALKNVQDYEVEVKNKLEEIIKCTYDSHCYFIDDFSIGDEYIEVTYNYTCRGYSDTDYISIPRKWLDEGFDYKAAYEKLKKEREEEQKRIALEEKKKAEAKKAKEEYKQYLKLKEKYESK